MISDNLRLSIVIPTMNEEKSIGKVIERIKNSVKYDYEIIIVDSSTDNTPLIAESMGARVIKEKRKGYGRAYKTGFLNATGNIIATMDGDNTYPPEEIN
ncbi:MAG: glycosyltransferase family 2 protein, partial [Thermoplasmata archaeon]